MAVPAVLRTTQHFDVISVLSQKNDDLMRFVAILKLMQYCHSTVVCLQSEKLASELVQKLPAGALAALFATLSVSSGDVVRAAEYYTPPSNGSTTTENVRPQQSLEFPSGSTAVAPSVKGDYQLPEGNQWRYSEFINAVQAGKVERVRFSKDGSQLQVCCIIIISTSAVVHDCYANRHTCMNDCFTSNPQQAGLCKTAYSCNVGCASWKCIYLSIIYFCNPADMHINTAASHDCLVYPIIDSHDIKATI